MALLIRLAALVGAAAAYSVVPPRQAARAPLQMWQDDLAAATRYLADDERLECFHALKMAHRVHDGQLRRDGQPFVTHPIAVARLVANWGMDGQCVMAALLHDAVEDTPLTFTEVEECFGPEVRGLVQGVTRVSKLDPTKLSELGSSGALQQRAVLSSSSGSSSSSGVSSSSSRGSGGGSSILDGLSYRGGEGGQCDKARSTSLDVLSLLHACAGDWRVAVLKLADRLHNMRTLDAMQPHKRAKKAQETQRVFVPLAHYLGAHDVAAELARLAAQHRADDQPQHKMYFARLTNSVAHALAATAAIPRRQLDLALSLPHARTSAKPTRWRPPSFARPPAARARTAGAERSFFNLVRQLSNDAAEPGRATRLYVSLRPLHERLARHQAVMMGESADDDAADA